MRRFEFWQDDPAPVLPRAVVTRLGKVAEGVEFGDGAVVVRWCEVPASTAVWVCMADARVTHEAAGTRLVWVDAAPVG